MRTIIVLLATTGLRLKECMSLRKDGVDLEARELRVLGKGNKRRVVPLLESTAGMLANYLEERPSESPYVFPGRTKTGYAEIYNIEKTLKRACLRAGVEPFTPHGLRHFYATEMLRSVCEAGGGGEDTWPLQHRDNGGHLPPCQDGGDARGAHEVRAHERQVAAPFKLAYIWPFFHCCSHILHPPPLPC